LHDENGEMTGVVNMIVDVTEVREVEHDAHRLAAIVESSNDAIIGTDLAGRITSWNGSAERMFGYTAAEAIGQPVMFLIPPDRSDEGLDILERLRRGEKIATFDSVRVCKDGRRIDISLTVSPIRDAQGRIVGGSKIARDITAQKRALRALAESEERLRLATRAGKIGLWDCDLAANHVTWSDSIHENGAVPSKSFEATIEGCLALIHPEDRVPVERAMQSSLRHDVPCELEFRIVRPGGAVAWLFANAIVLRENGRPVRMVGTTLDITARKTAELALRESEARFRTLASHAPVGIFVTDTNGDCVFTNESWRLMSGLTPDQARGKGWAAALHPDDRERVFAEWYAAVRERRPFAAEYRFRRPDGKVFWLAGTAIESRNAQGVVTGYIGTTVDLTQRRNAEEAVRESEKRFRMLASHAPVGIFLTDAQGDTLFVNEAWTRIVGIDAATARGRGWIDAIHSDDRARVVTNWEQALRSGASSEAEYRFRRADGSITWVQGNAMQLLDEAGGPAGYIGTLIDVTDRKIAEEKLRAREAQLRLISTNAPINLAHCSRDGRFLFVNRANAERFGCEPEQLIGRTLAEVMGEEAMAAARPWIDRVLAGEAVAYEAEIPYKGVGTRFVHVSYVPDFAEDGTVRGWLAAATDLTERREMEQALREAQTKLQQHAQELERNVVERTASLREAIVQMEEFSYSVSHDLRAPLRAMNAYAQALVEDYGDKLDHTARHYLERIQRSSQRMEKLTHDVLTYSRVARAEMRLAPIELETVLRDLISQYAELQLPTAEVEIARPLHRVLGHESSLGQCLANLLTNAAKFVEPGVRPKIRVRTEAVGERVRIWIEDNGIGIAPEYHAMLFRVFERVPTHRAYDGTGIGLAIVRKAAEKMNGRCGVESDGRSGSRFWIELGQPPPE
jgi:PAS domain S-box-containing protein